MPKGQRRQLSAILWRKATATHRRQHAVITRGFDNHGNAGVVLGRGPHHGRSADVDLLHTLVNLGPGVHRLAERIEVHHDQIERVDLQPLERRNMLGVAGVGQQAGMDMGMKSLDTAVQHFRKSRDEFHRGHRNPLGGNCFRG